MAGNNTGGNAHHHKRFSSSLSESLRKGMASMDIPIDALRDFTASRLPTYRKTDLFSAAHGSPSPQTLFFDTKASSDDDERLSPISPPEHGHGQHTRNKSASSAQLTTTSTAPSAVREDHNYAPRMNRQSTFPSTQSEVLVRSPQVPLNDATSNVSATPKQANPRASRAGKNNNGSYPPLSMITQNRGHFFEQQQPVEVDLANSTTNWVTQQQKQQSGMAALQDSSAEQPQHPQQGQILAGDEQQQPRESQPREQRLSLTRSQTEPASGRPLIKPIRGFKLSSQRKSTEMASRRTSYNDQDTTLRALEGRDNTFHAPSQSEQQDENNSDESSDLFLRAAREEELQAKSIMNNGEGPARPNSLRSRAPSGSTFQQLPEVRHSVHVQRSSIPILLASRFTLACLSSKAMCGLWLISFTDRP